jgi:hypothetical protein
MWNHQIAICEEILIWEIQSQRAFNLDFQVMKIKMTHKYILYLYLEEGILLDIHKENW